MQLMPLDPAAAEGIAFSHLMLLVLFAMHQHWHWAKMGPVGQLVGQRALVVRAAPARVAGPVAEQQHRMRVVEPVGQYWA